VLNNIFYRNTEWNIKFWHVIQVLSTNNKLLIKTEVVDDRREPKILFDLVDGRQLEVGWGIAGVSEKGGGVGWQRELSARNGTWLYEYSSRKKGYVQDLNVRDSVLWKSCKGFLRREDDSKKGTRFWNPRTHPLYWWEERG
jgi:hypothetical protein